MVVWQELRKLQVEHATPEATAQVQILALPLIGCVTLGKLLSFSVPQLLYLYYGDNNKTSLIRL